MSLQQIVLKGRDVLFMLIMVLFSSMLFGCNQNEDSTNDTSTTNYTETTNEIVIPNVPVKDGYVETVLGPISTKDLGMTLMHEHIIWDWYGADESRNIDYSPNDVVEIILPYLEALKEAGCKTLVEGSPKGAGRDIEVLKLAAERSGLNIITNTGLWNGGYGVTVPNDIKDKTVDEIVEKWVKEYTDGIEGTGVKPGFIKITLPDRGEISDENLKYFRAAVKVSNQTGLPIQCHSLRAIKVKEMMYIIEEENLPYNQFIWIHADYEKNIDKIIEMAEEGIWIELDALGRARDLDWHVEALKRLIEEDLIDHVLISQDAGSYNVGHYVHNVIPYDRIFVEFIPLCKNEGISEEIIYKIFIQNPAEVLGLEN